VQNAFFATEWPDNQQMASKTKVQLKGPNSLTRVTARRKMASLRVSSRRRLFRVGVNRGQDERLLATAVANRGKLSVD
jgi:hypothetical protein